MDEVEDFLELDLEEQKWKERRNPTFLVQNFQSLHGVEGHDYRRYKDEGHCYVGHNVCCV